MTKKHRNICENHLMPKLMHKLLQNIETSAVLFPFIKRTVHVDHLSGKASSGYELTRAVIVNMTSIWHQILLSVWGCGTGAFFPHKIPIFCILVCFCAVMKGALQGARCIATDTGNGWSSTLDFKPIWSISEISAKIKWGSLYPCVIRRQQILCKNCN